VKYFNESIGQEKKSGYLVCGDYYVYDRSQEVSVFILCDGIGSGVYANIAAITCASRLLALLQGGVYLRSAIEMVASSMHRARTENIPFSAFSVLYVLKEGQFAAYTYEAPDVIMVRDGVAEDMKPRFYTAGYEVIGEVTGSLENDSYVCLMSDGVTQAGMGHGDGMGLGTDGIVGFINQYSEAITDLPAGILEKCKDVSGHNFEDDTTFIMIGARDGAQLNLLTGPPSRQALDSTYVNEFMQEPGKKVICGSTTADIVSRELNKPVKMLKNGLGMGMPPEYRIDGIDLTTEGAVQLNQVCNILDEPVENLTENTAVERWSRMLHEADVVNIMMGNALNMAHEDLLFKQIGIKVRRAAVNLLVEKLRGMGKVVMEKTY
jgi:hypothetical protein